MTFWLSTGLRVRYCGRKRRYVVDNNQLSQFQFGACADKFGAGPDCVGGGYADGNQEAGRRVAREPRGAIM